MIRGYPERDTEEEEGHLKGRFECPKVSTSTIFNQWGKRYISDLIRARRRAPGSKAKAVKTLNLFIYLFILVKKFVV